MSNPTGDALRFSETIPRHRWAPPGRGSHGTPAGRAARAPTPATAPGSENATEPQAEDAARLAVRFDDGRIDHEE